ncbi:MULTISPECIES: sugar efflux transporter [Actinosynnema]|uniref:sugar efflux transporter n=1 Tax=Actinosynnema TaxID=40566 RepID=UPI0020A2FC67|nr:sugar efflux transporter [Actinosynnema pretiosum]MCP2092483.1 MFS transporter, SET family, sugar efflux transporter [Actinosynnema pretiosum]
MVTVVITTPRTPPTSLKQQLLPLATVVVLGGAGYALVGPLLSLFLIKELGANPFQVGSFMLVSALAALAVSTAVGRFSDRRAVRKQLLIVGSLSGTAAYVVFALSREYLLLLLVSVTLAALSSIMVPQSFAYARQSLSASGSSRGPLATSALRTLLSLSWAIAPPLAAIFVERSSFTWVFAGAAVMYALAALAAWYRLPALPKPEPVVLMPDSVAVPSRARGELSLTAVAFVLLQGTTALSVAVLPLFVVDDLGGTAGNAGVAMGVCAALEIPMMLWLGFVAAKIDNRLLVLAGAVLALSYHAVMLVSGEVWHVIAAQLLHALAISALQGIGISYFQDLDPDFPGRATTLFTNTGKAGSMLSGPLLALAQANGYRTAFAIGAVMAVTGLALLLLARPRRAGRPRTDVGAMP